MDFITHHYEHTHDNFIIYTRWRSKKQKKVLSTFKPYNSGWPKKLELAMLYFEVTTINVLTVS